MKHSPAVKQVASVLCLLIAGAQVPAFGAPRPATTTRTTRSHRPRVLVDSNNPAKDDIAGYDDPVVREIALEALGHEKGSVVAVDPTSGRVLAIVNQKMAFSSALEPCSTIKPFIALGGLQEGVITRDTMIRVAPRHYMDLTEAMAHSNNNFFQEVGTRLGFDRVIKYDSLLGLGQRVGYNIPEEQSGALPTHPPIFGGGRAHVEFRLGHSHDALPARVPRFHFGERRNAILPSISAQFGGPSQF